MSRESLSSQIRPSRLIYSRFGRPAIILFGISISALCLYLAFRKMDWVELGHHLRSMSLWAVFLGLVLTNINNFLLAKRWAILIQPLGRVSYWTAFWSLRISYFFNATLPARLGEPFRIYYINRRTKIPATKAIGCLGADRFLDFMTMLSLLYVSVIVLGLRGTLPQTRTILIVSSFIVVAFVAVTKLPKTSKWRWFDRLLKIRSNILEGMAPLLKWKILLPTIPISFLSWFIHATVVVGFAYGVGAPISLFKAFMVVAGVTVAIAIPASPGHIGTFELGAMTMLRYFGVPIEEAASIAILYHMIQLIPTLLIGAYGYYFHFLKLPKVSPVVGLETPPLTFEEPEKKAKIVYH